MTAAKVSLLANAVFVGLLAALHGLKPELDPSWRFISEYAIGKFGWLMQVAFLALAVANLAMWSAIRDCLRTVPGRVGSGMYLLGTLGLVLAAIFVTDPINALPESRTTSGNLHNIGGGLGLFGFLGTLVFSVRLLRCPAWRSARPVVWIASAILVLGFLVAFISISAIAARHNNVFGPDTPVGWPNRIGILSGCAWLAIIARQAMQLARQQADPARSNSDPLPAGT